MRGFALRLIAAGTRLALGAMFAASATLVLAQTPQLPRTPRAAPAAPAAPAPPAAAASAPPAAASAPSATLSGEGGREPGAAAPTQQAPPPIPTRTEILNLDNWVVTCNEFAEGPRKRVCSALLHIVQQNTNQTVFSWIVAVENNKQMVTIMQTPTGVSIPPGVELRVGKLAPQRVPFASCDNGRCLATMPMDSALLHEMTVVPTAEAVIQGSQGNAVQFNIQLKGFDRAYAVLSKS